MMQLYEFQAKSVFQENGIPTPRGILCRNVQEAVEAAERLKAPVVVKAQVLAGGRGLAGGIKPAENPTEAGKLASQILGMTIKGERPAALLVEEKLVPTRELYTAITYDYQHKCPVIICSSRGGVDIETVAKQYPANVVRKQIDPFRGLSAYHGRDLAGQIGLVGDTVVQYAAIVSGLWKIFKKHDAELVEINPMAVTSNGKLIALDAKLNLDDKSTARQSDLINRLAKIALTELEGYEARRARAKELGIPTYIEMQGNIGVIADGAGTGMLTLDLLADYGGKTSVYCEMGGETTAELMEKTMLATLSSKSVKVVLINLIGGLNLMDEMAKGITSYLKKHQTNIPIVVRMSGTREEEGRRILSADKIQSYDNLYEAVQKAVDLSGGK